jgi:hypothetical protein
MAVVRHKRWHPQIFAHRMLMQVQTADDFCLSVPLRGKFMHVLMHRHLPGTPRTRCRGLAPRRLTPRTIGLGRLRWSQGRLLGFFFTRFPCLTEHIDLVRQRFLDHFPQILEQVPAVKHLFGSRCSFRRSFEVTGPTITANNLDSRMLTKPVGKNLLAATRTSHQPVDAAPDQPAMSLLDGHEKTNHRRQEPEA